MNLAHIPTDMLLMRLNHLFEVHMLLWPLIISFERAIFIIFFGAENTSAIYLLQGLLLLIVRLFLMLWWRPLRAILVILPILIVKLLMMRNLLWLPSTKLFRVLQPLILDESNAFSMLLLSADNNLTVV